MKNRHWKRIDNDGITFTELGFGTAPLGNIYQAIGEDVANDILEAAWAGGCRYYDTAPFYGLGLAETRLNRFFRGKSRDEYVLSTKVGRLLEPCPPEERAGIGKFFETPSRREVFDYTYDGIMRSIDMSFARLGVDHIDILFVHDIDVSTHGSKEASDAYIDQLMGSGYYALLALRDQGVIQAFGAGINEWQPAQTLAERGDFDIFLLAGRYTLLEQEALGTFLPLCEQRGIGIVLGGPYNSGILATGAVPGAYYNYEPAPDDIVNRVKRVETICRAHNVALVEAALQFPLFHPSVVSIIPGGQSVSQTEANLKILDAVIPPALWTDLKSEGLLDERAPVSREA